MPPRTALAADLTVVIPTLGREILSESLAALSLGTMRAARIIVVHQGEDPRVAQWVADADPEGAVTYVPSNERGRARGVNRGISLVETRFAAVTDDDCLADPAWIQRMRARLLERPDAIVTGRVEATGPEAATAVVTSRTYAEHRRPRLRHDSLSGGNMGAAVEVLRRIGPFDEDPCLATAEDNEYAYRALRSGVPIIYDPDVVVSHVGWRTEPERLVQYDGYARSLAGFMGKYLRRGDAFIAARVAVHFLRSSRRWLIGVLTGDRERAANGRAYVRGLLAGLRAGWRSGP